MIRPKSLTIAYKVLRGLALAFPVMAFPTWRLLYTRLSSHWPHCCSSHTPDVLPRHNLRNRCFLCLEDASQIFPWLTLISLGSLLKFHLLWERPFPKNQACFSDHIPSLPGSFPLFLSIAFFPPDIFMYLFIYAPWDQLRILFYFPLYVLFQNSSWNIDKAY